MSQRRYAVFAGGGTAGHVFVSLAVAQALVDAGVAQDQIELIGSARAADGTLAASSGYRVTLLPGRGLLRKPTPEAFVRNLRAAGALAVATGRALVVLLRRRPRVLVSVGGYASVPAGLAAAVLRIPIVLVNVDARPGLAQRLLSPFAKASAVGFAGTRLRHPVVTGVPVRTGLGAGHGPDRAAADRVTLGLPPDRRTVGVVGGSLGAGRINDATVAMAARYRDRGGLTVYHVSGPRNFEAVSAARADAGIPSDGDASGLCYRLVAFEENMAAFFGASDLVVSRAGALTVAEIAASGVPSVLVPLPGAPGDHQTHNALALQGAGAAVMLADADCTGEALDRILTGLTEEP
ncbi:MAG: UDP-N-acetylglucosamine--N-acetylmuramyl-(pentapeptide) pyrophosphoryl-undecaprenol N-acetylglucosamine transferase, partial [Acidimicrobiales bacterium]